MPDRNTSQQTNGVSKRQQTLSTNSSHKQDDYHYLPAAIEGSAFVEPLARLVSAKRTLELTRHQTETWVSALSIYKETPEIVHRAILKLATSDDPFPDLSKLLTLCERIRRETNNVHTQDPEKTKFNRIEALAKVWGIEV